MTTIEPQVQIFGEKLTEVKDKYSIDSIGGIIMNPQDGSIYALSSADLIRIIFRKSRIVLFLPIH